MPTYKLTYFNARGRAELCRLLFAQAGVEYEDYRLDRAAWPEIKPTTPFGQIPLLEVDGTVIAQSDAMARYLARQFKLAGKTPIEEALADAVCGALSDLAEILVKIIHAKTDEEKKENTEKLPTQFATLEAYLVKQHGGDGYFVGDSLTWADLKAFDIIDHVQKHFPDTLKACPKLVAHSARIGALPKIKEWVDKRPASEI